MNNYGRRLSCQEYRLKADRVCDHNRTQLNKVYFTYILIMILFFIIDSFTVLTFFFSDGTEIHSTWFRSLFDLIFGGVLMTGLIEISKKAYYKFEIKNRDFFMDLKILLNLS